MCCRGGVARRGGVSPGVVTADWLTEITCHRSARRAVSLSQSRVNVAVADSDLFIAVSLYADRKKNKIYLKNRSLKRVWMIVLVLFY